MDGLELLLNNVASDNRNKNVTSGTVQQEGFCKQLLQSLQKQQKVRQFCDIAIGLANSHTCCAHACILAAHSPYISMVLTAYANDNRAEGSPHFQRIDLSDTGIKVDIFEILLNYCYSGDLSLSLEQLTDVYHSATLLQIEPLKELCIDFLKQNLNIVNHCEIFKLAQSLNITTVSKAVMQFVINNFSHIKLPEVFNEFSYTDLVYVLRACNKDRNHELERRKLNIVFRWLCHKPSDRIPVYTTAIESIDYKLINREQFASLLCESACQNYGLHQNELVKNIVEHATFRSSVEKDAGDNILSDDDMINSSDSISECYLKNLENVQDVESETGAHDLSVLEDLQLNFSSEHDLNQRGQEERLTALVQSSSFIVTENLDTNNHNQALEESGIESNKKILTSENIANSSTLETVEKPPLMDHALESKLCSILHEQFGRNIEMNSLDSFIHESGCDFIGEQGKCDRKQVKGYSAESFIQNRESVHSRNKTCTTGQTMVNSSDVTYKESTTIDANLFPSSKQTPSLDSKPTYLVHSFNSLEQQEMSRKWMEKFSETNCPKTLINSNCKETLDFNEQNTEQNKLENNGKVNRETSEIIKSTNNSLRENDGKILKDIDECISSYLILKDANESPEKNKETIIEDEKQLSVEENKDDVELSNVEGKEKGSLEYAEGAMHLSLLAEAAESVRPLSEDQVHASGSLSGDYNNPTIYTVRTLKTEKVPLYNDSMLKTRCLKPRTNQVKEKKLPKSKASTGGEHKCSKCHKVFYTPCTLKQHMKGHGSDVPFLCEICGFTTIHFGSLAVHKKQHTGNKFKCQVPGCSYETVRKERIVAHQNSHNGKRNFVCSLCNKAFVAKKHLSRHEKTHDTCRKFKCLDCDYASNRQDKYRNHVRKHHRSTALSIGLLTKEEIEQGKAPDFPKRKISSEKKRRKNDSKTTNKKENCSEIPTENFTQPLVNSVPWVLFSQSMQTSQPQQEAMQLGQTVPVFSSAQSAYTDKPFSEGNIISVCKEASHHGVVSADAYHNSSTFSTTSIMDDMLSVFPNSVTSQQTSDSHLQLVIAPPSSGWL